MIRLNVNTDFFDSKEGSRRLNLSDSFSLRVWTRALTRARRLLGLDPSIIEITFVDEKDIEELSSKYRKESSPTDVLSFNFESAKAVRKGAKPQKENAEKSKDDGKKAGRAVMGEVIVCPGVVLRNSIRFKTTFSEELLRVIVHGMIHLKGLDHEPFNFPLQTDINPKDFSEKEKQNYVSAKKMFDLQEGTVRQLGWDVFVPRIIVGLGNPGEKYANTRHNAGHRAIDELTKLIHSKKAKGARCETELFSKYGAEIASARAVVFVKPQIGMNRSGGVVSEICKAYSVDPRESLLVIHDELDIPTGEYKFSYSKGRLHKGVFDIEKSLKTTRFWRLRVGVDSREGSRIMKGSEYVLSDFSSDDAKLFVLSLTKATVEIVSKMP